MRVRAKDEPTELECDKGHMTDYIESLWESTNPMWQLCVATHPFFQLGLHSLLFGGKFNIARVHITKNGQQQLVHHILQGNGNLAARKEEGMGGATPLTDQMTKIEQVPIVRDRRGCSQKNRFGCLGHLSFWVNGVELLLIFLYQKKK